MHTLELNRRINNACDDLDRLVMKRAQSSFDQWKEMLRLLAFSEDTYESHMLLGYLQWQLLTFVYADAVERAESIFLELESDIKAWRSAHTAERDSTQDEHEPDIWESLRQFHGSNLSPQQLARTISQRILADIFSGQDEEHFDRELWDPYEFILTVSAYIGRGYSLLASLRAAGKNQPKVIHESILFEMTINTDTTRSVTPMSWLHIIQRLSLMVHPGHSPLQHLLSDLHDQAVHRVLNDDAIDKASALRQLAAIRATCNATMSEIG